MTKLADVILYDVIGSRPAAGIPGRLFYATDTMVLSRDNGSSWDNYVLSGSGATIGTGADASKPSPGTSGDVYLPNNGVQIYRSNGVNQIPWGLLFPFTAPDDSLFAWRNQGGASVDTTHGGIYLLAPLSTTNNLRIREVAYPATPFTLTIALSLQCASYNGIAGICIVDSASGKLEIMHVGDYFLQTSDFTNVTTFSANVGLTGGNGGTGSAVVQWLRLNDTGAGGGNLRIWSHSLDGQHWQQLASVSNTAFLTPNKLGFFADAPDANFQTGVTLLSWKVT